MWIGNIYLGQTLLSYRLITGQNSIYVGGSSSALELRIWEMYEIVHDDSENTWWSSAAYSGKELIKEQKYLHNDYEYSNTPIWIIIVWWCRWM